MIDIIIVGSRLQAISYLSNGESSAERVAWLFIGGMDNSYFESVVGSQSESQSLSRFTFLKFLKIIFSNRKSGYKIFVGDIRDYVSIVTILFFSRKVSSILDDGNFAVIWQRLPSLKVFSLYQFTKSKTLGLIKYTLFIFAFNKIKNLKITFLSPRAREISSLNQEDFPQIPKVENTAVVLGTGLCEIGWMDHRDFLLMIIKLFTYCKKLNKRACYLPHPRESNEQINLARLAGFEILDNKVGAEEFARRNDHINNQFIGYSTGAITSLLYFTEFSKVSHFSITDLMRSKYNRRQTRFLSYAVRTRVSLGGYGERFSLHYLKARDIGVKFIKLSEVNDSNTDKFEKLLVYVSGFCPKRPQVGGTLVSPAWSWLQEKDICLSGVNFSNELAQDYLSNNLQRKAPDKEFRALYVGSSSLNKNAITALFTLWFSRVSALFADTKCKPDVMLLYRFRGIKGALIYCLALCLKYLFLCPLLGLEINIRKKAFNKEKVNQLLSKSEYCLIPYLREGFPRVLGEALVFECTPLVWKNLSFADEEVEGIFESNSFSRILSALSPEGEFNYNQLGSLKERLFDLEYRKEKLYEALPLDLSDYLKSLNSQVSTLLVYFLLTKDLKVLDKKHLERVGE